MGRGSADQVGLRDRRLGFGFDDVERMEHTIISLGWRCKQESVALGKHENWITKTRTRQLSEACRMELGHSWRISLGIIIFITVPC